jgi:diadenosine tetraphosphatase ApaH/serine/threonine PP2A family protein phosphatase
MFSPSASDVRQFFCSVYAKAKNRKALEAIEVIANEWLKEHPEHHALLADATAAQQAQFPVEAGGSNPFLHLSMHLSISEQCSIDQPRGIRQAVELLTKRRHSLHEAHHEVMECLGQMLWDSQRSGQPPDGEAYIACVQRQGSHD